MCESRLENVSANQLNTIFRVLLALVGGGLLFLIGAVFR